jgi:hypothetical protein
LHERGLALLAISGLLIYLGAPMPLADNPMRPIIKLVIVTAVVIIAVASLWAFGT